MLLSLLSEAEVFMIIGVTGSRGVLGRRIARYLAHCGYEVRTLDEDVCDRHELQRWAKSLGRIVHCAAVVPVVRVNSDPYRAAETNVLGSLNVAKLTELTKDRHMTYISSSHVYKASSRPITEEDILEPSSLYGLTKLQGEQWVQALSPRYLIIRVFSFFASDQSEHFLVPSLAKRIAAAENRATIELANADAVRDIADADWIAEGCSRLVLSDKVGIVNCGTGQGHTVGDIAKKLGNAMGRKDVRRHFVRASSDRSEGQLIADVSRLTEMLGEPPGFDLDAALGKFAAERIGSLHA